MQTVDTPAPAIPPPDRPTNRERGLGDKATRRSSPPGKAENAPDPAVSDVDRGLAAPPAKRQPPKPARQPAPLTTLTLPVRVYFVRRMLAGEFLKPGPCEVWAEPEIRKILDVARATMDRLLAIQLAVGGASVAIDAPTVESLYFQESASISKQQAQFSRIVQNGLPSQVVSFEPSETHVLFTGRIYRKDKQTRTAKGLLLGIDGKRDFDLGGNQIVIAYTYAGEKRPPEEAKRHCDMMATFRPDLDVLGVTLAHELGHSLHLRHLEDSGDIHRKATAVERRTNLMRRSVELSRTDPTLPPNPGAYQLFPAQREQARRYGRCRGRFRGAAPLPGDKCADLVKELGLD